MEEQRSAREELVVKARKPYTITKQREKWTEEEHNSFLEALKLYGRAWQRIEDHIGTKTAVQIRSHAQKFFTKLEKEALSKGASPGNVHDIDIHIPPPRPKRKPNSPYPRKTTTIGSLSPSGEASAAAAAAAEGIKPPNPIYLKNDANKQVLQDEENSEGANSSEVLNITQHGWLSVSTSNQGGSTSPILMEFFPTITSSKEIAAVDNLASPVQSNHHVSSSKQAHSSVGINRSKEKNGQTLTGSDNPGPAATVSPPLLQFQHNLALGLQHQFSPPVVPHNNQQGSYDASFLNMSSAFSNLIISTLQQIPPVHAAASLAASGHLCLNPEIPGGEAPVRDMKPSPSMPSLVTATIAAAGAWWATQGIMPWCSPVFPSPTTIKVPPTTMETMQVPPPPPEQHPSDILKQPQSSPKPVSSSSSPSDASAKGENSEFSVLNQAKASKNTVSDEFGIEDNKTKCCIGETRDQNHTAFGASLERQPYGFALHTGVAQTKGGVPTKVIENNTEASSSNNNFKHGNFKASRSVFKPYKRCSVEAQENKTTREETGNKRICLPEEA